MSKQTPFTLKIFVANGDPDGLRVVERSNWIGKALVFPRSLYPDIRSRPEFQQTGVYLLSGPSVDGSSEALYIGEGDPVRPRLEEHYAKKDFWTRAVFFVAGPGQLNKAHVQYLEAMLVTLALSAKRMPLENGNKPSEPSLSESERADMDVFLNNILGILPVLGVHAFEQTPVFTARHGAPVFFCRGPRNANGTGHDTPQGFIVRTGSYASITEVPSLKDFPVVGRTRAELLRSGVLVAAGDKLKFTQDFAFNSPSLAAAVVLGRSSNGRLDWKDENGKTLREFQQAQSES
jgi:hypothetical protein